MVEALVISYSTDFRTFNIEENTLKLQNFLSKLTILTLTSGLTFSAFSFSAGSKPLEDCSQSVFDTCKRTTGVLEAISTIGADLILSEKMIPIQLCMTTFGQAGVPLRITKERGDKKIVSIICLPIKANERLDIQN